MRLIKQKGFALIPLIIAMVLMSALGAGIYSVTTSSTFGGLLAGRDYGAYQLAKSGMRYAIFKNLTTTDEYCMSSGCFKITVDNSDPLNRKYSVEGKVNQGTFLAANRTLKYTLALNSVGNQLGPQLINPSVLVRGNPFGTDNDNTGEWGTPTSVTGGGTTATALHVTESESGQAVIGYSGGSSANPFQIAWQNAGNYLSYDAQVKIALGTPPFIDVDDKRDAYVAGITFRATGSTEDNWKQYGLSFARLVPDHNISSTLDPMGMMTTLIHDNSPYSQNVVGWYTGGNSISEGYYKCATATCTVDNNEHLGGVVGTNWVAYTPPTSPKPMILLWTRSGDGDEFYQWLAYKELADEPITGIVDADGYLKPFSTLLLRVVEAASLKLNTVTTTFDVGGAFVTVAVGDTITADTGSTPGGFSAKVIKIINDSGDGNVVLLLNGNGVGVPLLTPTGTFKKAGTTLPISDSWKTGVAGGGAYRERDNYIWAMFGDTDAHPSGFTGDTDALLDTRRANARVSDNALVTSTDINDLIHWPPPISIEDWTADYDYFKLSAWNVNMNQTVTGDSTMRIMGTGKEAGAILRTASRVTSGYATFPFEFGLHTLGNADEHTYFDDLAINFPGGGTSACQYDVVDVTTSNMSAHGDNLTDNFTIYTGACDWVTTTDQAWLRFDKQNGTGPIRTFYTVDPNTGPERHAHITIAGKPFIITQESGCSYSLSSNQEFNSEAGSGSFTVTAGPGCAWTAAAVLESTSTPADWLHLTSGTTGAGTGSAESGTFTVDRNPGGERDADITIQGTNTHFRVRQLAYSCAVTIINPASATANLPSNAGSDNFDIQTGAGCVLQTSTDVAWIPQILTSSNSAEIRTIIYDYTDRDAIISTGHIYVTNDRGGQGVFTVNRNSTCSLTITSPNPNNVLYNYNSGVDVQFKTSCNWEASDNANWLDIQTGGTGSSSTANAETVRTAHYHLDSANTGPLRTALVTITVGGTGGAQKIYTLNQGNGCYLVTPVPSPANFGLLGTDDGEAYFDVTGTGSCTGPWNATTSDTWIQTSSSGNGSGSGIYKVLSSGGIGRIGYISVRGNPVAGPGSFEVNQRIDQAALTVVATTPMSYNTWQTLGTSGGSGNGAVSYSVTGNCSLSVTTLTANSGSGSCSVTATKAADTNYNAVTSAAKTITLQKADQAALTVVVTPSTVSYGSTATLSTNGGSGGGAVTYNYVSGNCSVAGSTLTAGPGSGANSCSVTATKAESTNYNAITSAAVTVTLQKANQATLTVVVTPSTVTYGSTAVLSTTGGSGSGVVIYNYVSGNCSVAGTTLTAGSSGGGNSCSVTATKAESINYNAITSAAVAVTLTTPLYCTTGGTISNPVGFRVHTFSTAGTFSLSGCTGLGSATVQTIGGGGSGGTRDQADRFGGGGGGGAYASTTIALNPGATATSYSVVVGAGSTASTAPAAGGDSSFNSTAVVAKGGNSVGNSRNGVNGGSATSSTGSTKYSGGNGADYGNNYSGGGGGGAGSTGAGGNASGITHGNGNAPGGNGGDGVSSSGNSGNPGSTYGGGGGGSWMGGTYNSAVKGGNGGTGVVIISYPQ